MERLVVTTEVYRPPPVVYEFLEDFPGYATYSEYLREVRSSGGGEGRRYALTFAWWKLSYTARSEVTALDPPRRIDWRIVSDLDAGGRWEIDPLWELPEDAPEHVDGDDVSEAGDGESEADEDASGADADGGSQGNEADGDGADGDDRDPADAPASRVSFVAEFDPDSVHSGMVDLPSLVSLDWVIGKVRPKIESEATRVVERAVADIEGRPRSVDLETELVRE